MYVGRKPMRFTAFGIPHPNDSFFDATPELCPQFLFCRWLVLRVSSATGPMQTIFQLLRLVVHITPMMIRHAIILVGAIVEVD